MESHKQPSYSRSLVLCFDGTGNTFRADGTNTNVLKIFRMLDRTRDDQSMLPSTASQKPRGSVDRLYSLLLSAYCGYLERTE